MNTRHIILACLFVTLCSFALAQFSGFYDEEDYESTGVLDFYDHYESDDAEVLQNTFAPTVKVKDYHAADYQCRVNLNGFLEWNCPYDPKTPQLNPVSVMGGCLFWGHIFQVNSVICYSCSNKNEFPDYNSKTCRSSGILRTIYSW